jgi:arylformamidase
MLKKAQTIFLLVFFIVLSVYVHSGPLRDWLHDRQNNSAQDDLKVNSQPVDNIDLPNATHVLRDLPYGKDKLQRLDVYLPDSIDKQAAVIFMVHGGAWRIGDKAMPRVVQNKITRWVPKGAVFISVNYRLLPDADPLEQAEDVALALAFAQSKAYSWGADPKKFILMGHSAGAHLVLLVATSPRLAINSGAKPWLGTIALDSAAFDVVQIMKRKHYSFYDEAFGVNPDFWRSTSPIYALNENKNKSIAPIMAVCSTQRRDKSCIQAHEFGKAAAKLNARVEVLEQDKSHGEINGDLGMSGAYTDAVERFIISLDSELNF